MTFIIIMSELIQINTIYSFETNNIRVLGTHDYPKFIAKDVCKILELSNVSDALKCLPEKWRGIVSTDTPSGKQEMLYINEAGLYKLIMKSKKPAAQKFQEFVCEEVLPSIRKTGEYKLEEYKKIIEEKTQEINKLTKKYIKKPKQVFGESNVVYLMTTEESEKIREYVIGKSTDLSKRNYNYNNNKLHDFKVIYYRSCKDQKFMDLTESMVLMELENYRCKKDRDVFSLPESEDITLFTNAIDKSVKVFEKFNEAIYARRTTSEDKEKQKDRNEKYYEEHQDEIKEKMHDYYENNKDILSEIKKEYYEKNVVKIAKQHKAYYEENKEAVIETVMEYYHDNREKILEDRKEFYEDNKEHILEERAKYYKENYKTKIAAQRSKKEECECGMIISHYSMKRHKNSDRHKKLMDSKG